MKKVIKVAPEPVVEKVKIPPVEPVAPKIVAKKPVVKKPVTPKPVVEMVSYSIKMVIPTGQYANIQPEIIVKGGTIQEAHDFVAPHMNKLWKEYYMVGERRPETQKPAVPLNSYSNVQETTTISTTVPDQMQLVKGISPDPKVMGEMPVGTGPTVPPPDSGVAFIKANQAIASCLSLDALELIQAQVIKSVKLSHEDKEALMPLIEAKSVELFGDKKDE